MKRISVIYTSISSVSMYLRMVNAELVTPPQLSPHM